MTVRITESGDLVVGNVALPAAVVPAVREFFATEEQDHGVQGECSQCRSWPVPADPKNEGLSLCCGSYLITD